MQKNRKFTLINLDEVAERIGHESSHSSDPAASCLIVAPKTFVHNRLGPRLTQLSWCIRRHRKRLKTFNRAADISISLSS